MASYTGFALGLFVFLFSEFNNHAYIIYHINIFMVIEFWEQEHKQSQGKVSS